MKRLFLTLALLLIPAAASAQCNGVFPNNTVCGNNTGAGNLPRPTPPTAFQGSAGGTNGQIQYNNSGALAGESQVTPAQGGTGVNNVSANQNDVLAYNGSGFIHTALITLLNTVCSASPSSCSLFFGYIDPVWYGAACNNTGDDHVAFQNAINLGITNNASRPVHWLGTCQITSGLTINGTLEFSGRGRQQSILVMASDVDTVTITTTLPVQLHDFNLTYSVPSTHNNIVIAPASSENQFSDFYNLFLQNGFNGLSALRASLWKFRDSDVFNYSGSGVVVANPNNVDSGDSIISGNNFTPATSATAMVTYQSSGGLRLLNNKLVGSGSVQYGLYMSLANGAVTSDLFVIGNSFEQANLIYGIYLSRAGTTGSFNNIIITGNECLARYCVVVPTDANGTWISGLLISNNVGSLTNNSGAIGFYVDSATGLNLEGNTINSVNAGTIPTYIGSAAAGFVKATTVTGSAASPVYGSSLVVVDDPIGLPFASLTSPANGSRIYINNADPASVPCTSSGSRSGSNAFRQNGVWRCL